MRLSRINWKWRRLGQAINITVLNPLFSLVFMGTALACLILGITSFFKLGTGSATYLLAGNLLYFACSFLVTIIFKIFHHRASPMVKFVGFHYYKTNKDRQLPKQV